MRIFIMKKYLIIILLSIVTVLSGETIGRVMKSNGVVLIKPVGGGTYSVNVKPGQAVSNGDALRVGEGSFAVVIYLDDKSVIKVRENTDFQFIDSQNTRVIRVEQGTTLHNVKTEGRNKPYRVETPVSVASVKGTEFSASHDPVAGVDLFVGKSGNFDVFNTISGMTVNVGPGQKAVSNVMGQLIPAPAQPGDYPEDPEGESPDEPQEEQEEPEEAPDDTQDQQEQQQQDTQTEEQRPRQEPEPETTSEAADTPVSYTHLTLPTKA